MSVPMKPIADWLPITGIEVYSAIRTFRHAHASDPDFNTTFQDHLLQQVDVLVGKVAQKKNELWLANRNLGTANSKIAKAELMRTQDALRIQELEEEVACLKREAVYKDILEELAENRREVMLARTPVMTLDNPLRGSTQAQLADEQRRFEDLLAKNREDFERLRDDLSTKRLDVDAKIGQVPSVLDQDSIKPETPARDPFSSTPHPGSMKDSSLAKASSVSKDSATKDTVAGDVSIVRAKTSLPHEPNNRKEFATKMPQEEEEHTFDADSTGSSFDLHHDESRVPDLDETFATDASILNLDNTMESSPMKVEDDVVSVSSIADDPNKENRPVLSTPPGSPDSLENRNIPQYAIEKHENESHFDTVNVKNTSSLREPLRTLYDDRTTSHLVPEALQSGAAKTQAVTDDVSQVSGSSGKENEDPNRKNSCSIKTQSRKRQASEEVDEACVLNSDVAHVQGGEIPVGRQIKRPRRSSAEARMNIG